jgi:uncharacterized membrane protein
VADRRLAAAVEVARDPPDIFAWVADYRNLPLVLEGVSRWAPLGDRSRGAGARFAVVVRVLGMALESVVVVDEWDEPRAIHWRSESAPVSGGWHFRPSPRGTEVAMSVGYRPPGGVLGGLAAGRIEGLARNRLETALARMKDILEGQPGGPGPGRR